MCVWQVAPSANPTPEFDPADLLPVPFGRGVSSLGGNSVYSCWMETDAYASRAERLIDSPVIRYQSMKRGQRFLKTAPTCSAAHRSSPPWLKLAIARLKKNLCIYFKCLCQLLQKKAKTFLTCRPPGKRWLQSRSLTLPPSGFSETICRCRSSSMGARLPSPSPGFAGGLRRGNPLFSDQMTQAALNTARTASCEWRQCTCNVKQVLDSKVPVLSFVVAKFRLLSKWRKRTLPHLRAGQMALERFSKPCSAM